MKNKLSELKRDFCFAYITDTRLADSGKKAAEEISCLDRDFGFECIVHGGNVLNGNNPQRISMELFGWEMERFSSSVKSGKILPVQGEKDGWRDECFTGQLALNIMTDDVWYENTKFVNASRPDNKPYYYVDFEDKKIRIVVACSYFYQYDREDKLFEKFRGFEAAQLSWLKNDALCPPEGYAVIIFSHTLPKTRFETGKDPFIYKTWSTEQNLMILQRAKRLNGVDIAGWIAGGYDNEEAAVVGGINYITTTSHLGEDGCWYAVSVDKDSRKLSLVSSNNTVTTVEY